MDENDNLKIIAGDYKLSANGDIAWLIAGGLLVMGAFLLAGSVIGSTTGALPIGSRLLIK